MHPASTTAASGGIAGSLVVILAWLLGLAHITVPADVAMALVVVVTGGIGYVMHGKMAAKDAAAPKPQPDAPSAPSVVAEAAKVGMLLLMLAVGAGALSACSTTPKADIAALEAGLAAADTAALAYVQLPPCAPSGPALCSKTDVVLKIGPADQAAYIAVKKAEAITAEGGSATDVQKAVDAATTAIQALQTLVPALAPAKGA